MNQAIISFLNAALECSVYVDPLDPGLTYAEIVEAGGRAGYQPGEIGDTLRYVTTEFVGANRLVPAGNATASWVFLSREDPEFRNFDAFDFVVAELNALAKAVGAVKAVLERSVVVERAVAKGIPRNAIEVAITYQVMTKTLVEKDGILRFPNNHGPRGLPSEQLKAGPNRTIHRPERARAFPIVKDVMERRTDGRSKQAEPLDAFADELDRLGFGAFRLWRKQTVAELRYSDPNFSSVSVSVLAAALVEGALAFVVRHARKNQLAVFQSNDFDGDPRRWISTNLLPAPRPAALPLFLILRSKIARKLSSAHDSGSTQDACWRSFSEDRLTYARKRRATRGLLRNRWCVAYSIGCRRVRCHDPTVARASCCWARTRGTGQIIILQ